MERLLTVKEVSEVLKCNVSYVHKLRRSGLLRFIKLGCYKVRESSLNEFLDKYDGMDVTDPGEVRDLL